MGIMLVGTATAVGTLGSNVLPAQADTDADTTIANVDVSSSITLTNLTPSFTLTGAPGSVPTTGATPVTMTVTTNNFAGYNVTVVPATANLVGAIPGNTDVIPSNDLEVNGPAQGAAYVHLIFGTPIVVATKASASEPDGDTITNNYRITVPFVRPDIYTGTLNYVATTL
ncbi:hypothetical protein [Sphaerisporangium corydalis]|uniref:WxL domain-containing protein n=1 Tax=Sphaerisporangium corydalis TaxID=1441875 RepID=A0ABV9EKC2_9ACTN|nr:hypothetical protein [Sphaerisporangium corydalis]